MKCNGSIQGCWFRKSMWCGYYGAISLISEFKVSFSCIWSKPMRKQFQAEITNIQKYFNHLCWVWMLKIEFRTVKVGDSLIFMLLKFCDPTIYIFQGASNYANVLTTPINLLQLSSIGLWSAINWLILMVMLLVQILILILILILKSIPIKNVLGLNTWLSL